MKHYLIASLAISLFAYLPAAAEEMHVATIDMSRVLNESPAGKEKRKQLELLSAAAQKKVEEKRSTVALLEKKIKESKSKENSPEVERFREQAKEFGRFVKDTEDDVKKEHLKFTKELLTTSYATVKKFAEAKKIDLVLDKSEKSRGPVLFGSDTMDITDAILDEMKKAS